jgi:hypothetical protein
LHLVDVAGQRAAMNLVEAVRKQLNDAAHPGALLLRMIVGRCGATRSRGRAEHQPFPITNIHSACLSSALGPSTSQPVGFSVSVWMR